jgi:hypothetical protein
MSASRVGVTTFRGPARPGAAGGALGGPPSASGSGAGGGASPAPAPASRGGWCKHACCLAYLVAERLTTDPFLIFTLRGLPREELLERLRQRRAVAGAGTGTVPVYAPVIPGVSDVEAPPLEECVEHFWDLGPEIEQVDMPVERPEVSHPLLRRLGPSPFGVGGGKFPLVGLLATCYDVISEAVLKAEENGAPEPRMSADGNGVEPRTDRDQDGSEAGAEPRVDTDQDGSESDPGTPDDLDAA